MSQCDNVVVSVQILTCWGGGVCGCFCVDVMGKKTLGAQNLFAVTFANSSQMVENGGKKV